MKEQGGRYETEGCRKVSKGRLREEQSVGHERLLSNQSFYRPLAVESSEERCGGRITNE